MNRINTLAKARQERGVLIAAHRGMARPTAAAEHVHRRTGGHTQHHTANKGIHRHSHHLSPFTWYGISLPRKKRKKPRGLLPNRAAGGKIKY